MKQLLLVIGALIFSASFCLAQSVTGCFRDGSGAGGATVCLPAIQASKSVAISVAASTTTELVPLVAATSRASAKAIYVTSFNFMAAGTNTVTLVYGTGTACADNQVVLTGGYPLIAQAGISAGVGVGPVLIIPQGNALCITTSGSGQLSGSVSYVQL